MKEIEIKAKLKDKKRVMAALTALGCSFEAPVSQDDTVYARNVGSLARFRDNDVFLRLRVKKGKGISKILFTLKKRGKNDLDSLEHETEVGSREEMERMLFLMGFKEAVRVSKTRIVTHHLGCEICIDDVEGLGSFIEMEKLTEEGDAELIQEELFQFFLTLGISRDDRAVSGYDILMFQKHEKK